MSKLIILVAYTATDLEQHAQALKQRGHEVVPMLGNADALRHRSQFEHADAVVVGESDDPAVREKFAQWLTQNFPKLKWLPVSSF